MKTRGLRMEFTSEGSLIPSKIQDRDSNEKRKVRKIYGTKIREALLKSLYSTDNSSSTDFSSSTSLNTYTSPNTYNNYNLDNSSNTNLNKDNKTSDGGEQEDSTKKQQQEKDQKKKESQERFVKKLADRICDTCYEEFAYCQRTFKRKIFEICTNVKRETNKELREKLLSGKMTVKELVRAETLELAPEDLKQKRAQEIEKHYIRNVILNHPNNTFSPKNYLSSPEHSLSPTSLFSTTFPNSSTNSSSFTDNGSTNMPSFTNNGSTNIPSYNKDNGGSVSSTVNSNNFSNKEQLEVKEGKLGDHSLINSSASLSSSFTGSLSSSSIGGTLENKANWDTTFNTTNSGNSSKKKNYSLEGLNKDKGEKRELDEMGKLGIKKKRVLSDSEDFFQDTSSNSVNKDNYPQLPHANPNNPSTTGTNNSSNNKKGEGTEIKREQSIKLLDPPECSFFTFEKVFLRISKRINNLPNSFQKPFLDPFNTAKKRLEMLMQRSSVLSKNFKVLNL